MITLFQHIHLKTALLLVISLWGFNLMAQLNINLIPINPNCGGFATGSITAIPTGASGPFTYSWSNGATNNPITGLLPGTYSVTVTAANGTTGSNSVTLTAPPPVVASIVVTSCGLPGAMTALPSGGIPPYTYIWSTGSNNQTISNLSIGEYCVTVLDNNNCGYATCSQIGQTLDVQTSTTPVQCGTGAGGTATAFPSGGVTPFSYNWSNGGNTATINNLAPGQYTVTLTAGNGCTATAVAVVGITSGNFNISLNATQPTCAGSSTGSISSSITGASMPFSYLWNTGATTSSISNVGAGTYVLTVTDFFGCVSSQTAVLTYQSNLTVTTNAFDPTCAGANNGSISANAGSGVPPYNYMWSNGASTATVNNIGAGTYTVTVTDALNCTATSSKTLTAPAVFTVTATATNASQCGLNDGTLTAVPGGGGSPPYTYQWSNGGTNNFLPNVMAGTYTVTVTSAFGCTASASSTVSQPPNLLVSVTGSNLVCGSQNNGTLTANVSYGTAPYFFSWSNGGVTQVLNSLPAGNYSVTVTSTEGCVGTGFKSIAGSPGINLDIDIEGVKCFGTPTGKITANASGGTPPLVFTWNNGAHTPAISNLIAGDYSVTITDAVGCSATEFITLTQPGALSLNFNNSTGSCGSSAFASVLVTGGTTPYLYSWTNGQTNQTIYDLAPGNYAVTVTDANNCSAASMVDIPAFPVLDLAVSSTNTTCNGTTDGTATATAIGGAAPFQYFWNTGATTPTIGPLQQGSYFVTLTDANGCTKTGSTTVVLGNGLNVSIASTPFICPGTQGEATATAAGGTGVYSYSWSNGQTSQTAINLNPSSYSVTVTDNTGCFGTAATVLPTGGNYGLGFNFTQVSCFGGSDGSIEVTVTGGILPYNFDWSSGQTTANLEDIPAGDYTVTISDSTGCTKQLDFTITEPTELVLTLTPTNGTCGNPAYINGNATGGTAPPSFQWDNGQTTPSIFNLASGWYRVTVTDANGCIKTDSAEVLDIPAPTCAVDLVQVISSIGAADGILEAVVSDGTMPFVFNWSNGQTSQVASNLMPNNHLVTVTDANNCTTSCSFLLFDAARLGDFTWLDADQDGIQDAGESGLGNVPVTVSGTTVYGDTISETTQSSATGYYAFDLQAGSYKLAFGTPAGYSPSPNLQGNSNLLDSDPNQLTGMTSTFSLSAAENNESMDAGYSVALPCDNVTDPGTICCDQSLCGPGIDPAPLEAGQDPSGGSGPLEYLWMFHNAPGPFDPSTWTSIPTATEASYDPGPLFETTYFIRCVRRENCLDFLESNIITVTVGNDAVAVITAPDAICVTDSINVAAQANSAGATYAWDFDGGSPATATDQNVQGITWSSFGIKTVTLTVSNNGCTSVATHQVNVSNSPVFCGEALIINAVATGDSSVLVDWYYADSDSVQRTYDVEWAWESSDFERIGAQDSVAQDAGILHFFTLHEGARRGANFYRVKLSDSDGTILYSNTVEVKLTGGFSLVHVYPNPFTNDLTVQIIDRYDAAITLQVISVDGRILGTYLAPTDTDILTIPASHFASGVYFVLAKYDGKPQKLVKVVKTNP